MTVSFTTTRPHWLSSDDSYFYSFSSKIKCPLSHTCRYSYGSSKSKRKGVAPSPLTDSLMIEGCQRPLQYLAVTANWSVRSISTESLVACNYELENRCRSFIKFLLCMGKSMKSINSSDSDATCSYWSYRNMSPVVRNSRRDFRQSS